MALTESEAQQVTLVRILEQSRDNGGQWSAGDAREATRRAMDLVPAKASFERFLARRAAWVLEELGRRPGWPALDFSRPAWPKVLGWLLALLALAAGFVTDHLAAEGRVNIVEIPLVGLIAWNLAVFAGLFLRRLSGLISRAGSSGGLFSRLLGEWRLGGALAGRGGGTPAWAKQFRREWSGLAARLNRARLELFLHGAAMFFAGGALGSLYVRGLVKEYRAGWESTFLSPEAIHAIAQVVLAPGAMLLDLPVPDVAHIAGLRFTDGGGEIARNWIHLYAASILAWIILPRLLLAIANGLSVWRLGRFFPLPTRGAYFTTLRALRRGSSVGVIAIPFRFELTPAVRDHLSRILGHIHGLAVNIAIRQPVLMGENQADWKEALGAEDPVAVLVLYPLAATAEADTHGHLLERVREAVQDNIPVIPIIDIGAYGQGDLERFRERCNQWRAVLDRAGGSPLFLDLQRPEDDETLKQLEARLNGRA